MGNDNNVVYDEIVVDNVLTSVLTGGLSSYKVLTCHPTEESIGLLRKLREELLEEENN